MVYFTSDTHFGHKALLNKKTGKDSGTSLRAVKWPTVEEMDEALLDAINSTVGPKDTLYHLGDFGMWRPAHYRMRIRCKDIRLIWGNHDKRNISNLFRHTWEVREIKICGKPTWLSHYSHFVWPKSHYGSFHLYGHSHGMRESTLDTLLPGRRSLDVGVDHMVRLLGSPRPISEQEVYDILSTRSGHDPVEFYRN